MGFTMPSDKNVFSTLVKGGYIPNIWAICMYEGRKSNGTWFCVRCCRKSVGYWAPSTA